MRAIVMTEPRHVEVVDDWPEPRAGDGEVVVAMRALGLCGSDLSVYDGRLSLPSTPWVMGHEGGGEIVAVGDGVTDRRVGQRVVVEPNYCCLTCRACRAGLTSECPNRRIVGINVPGLFAERVAVPARFTWPVPASVPDEALACVEPFAVAQAGLRRSGIGLRGAGGTAGSDEPTGHDEACLVVGAGSQGLLMCQALLAVGVRPHVVEPHEGRRALAEQIGARPVDPADARDFRTVFDTVGVPEAWETSLRAVRVGGTIFMIGMSSRPVQMSTMDLARRQLVIRGSLIYDHPDDFARTVTAVSDGAVVPARVLQHGASPDDAAATFAQARDVSGKSWIDLAAWREG